jgi:hypothetical protein
VNRIQSELFQRIDRLSQRLDTKVTEPSLSLEENQRASAELASIARRLAAILPDVSASAEERVERLARYVPNAVPRAELMISDHAKLVRMRQRLEDLVPGELTPEQRVDRLARYLGDARAEKLAS